MISIRKILYPVLTLGPGKRIGIWTQGCTHGCKNCIDTSTWAFNIKFDKNVTDVLKEVEHLMINNEVNGITISGGDPFMQTELVPFLKGLRSLGINDILVYTGYTLDQIMEKRLEEALEYIDVLIDGLYVEELNDNLPLRGSSNQRVIFFNDNVIEKYKPLFHKERTMQIIEGEKTYSIIGIAPKGFKNKYYETR
jgi:anaerobic ribonucleoside-triphosphate reductase activating protein